MMNVATEMHVWANPPPTKAALLEVAAPSAHRGELDQCVEQRSATYPCFYGVPPSGRVEQLNAHPASDSTPIS